MFRRTMLILGIATVAMTGIARAENSAPTYQGDPDVYKLIFEDQNFRVISASWKKGVIDKPHSHPVSFIVYPLDDCAIRVHNPDGTTRDVSSKAGTPFAAPVTPSHTAENISDHDCRAVFIERK
jgi:hypothetical protein